MRLMMMGTGPFAVPSFNSLLDSDHEVVGLVTRPVAPPRGRRKTPLNPMRDVAEQRNVPLLAPEDVNNDVVRQQLADLRPELLVVCDYGQILKKQTLQIAVLGGINLHASLLPKYRGAAPINWAIYHGEKTTGVTVIHMSPRMDAGPCLVQQETEIGDDEAADALEPRLAQLGAGTVHAAIDMLADWDGEAVLGFVQDPQLVTNAPRLRKSNGEIDWSRSAHQIRNQVRAMKPWPGSFTFWRRNQGNPVRVILDQVSVVDESTADAHFGEVVSSDQGHLWIASGEGMLSVEQIQPAGKRVMKIEEFLRGHPVKTGDQFGGNASV